MHSRRKLNCMQVFFRDRQRQKAARTKTLGLMWEWRALRYAQLGHICSFSSQYGTDVQKAASYPDRNRHFFLFQNVQDVLGAHVAVTF
jgi:hypothetical protein